MDIKVHCELDISFYDYDSKQLNDKAVRQIARWIRQILREECSYITLPMRCKEEWIEECTRKAKIKVKVQ